MTLSLKTKGKMIKLPAFELLPKQIPFLQAEERYINYTGGFGSGKTFILCVRAIIESLKYPNNFGLLGCKSYPMLRDTTIITFNEVIDKLQAAVDKQDLGIQLLKDFKTSEMKAILEGNSKIIFRSLGEPDDVSKLKSLNLGWAGIDEPTDISYNTFRMLQGRLRKPNVGHHLFMTGNPSSYSNWVYEFFYKDADKNADRIHFDATSKENIFLPEDYLQDLEKYDDAYYRRYVMGQWGDLEGLVYKNWSRPVHVIPPFEIPSGWERVRGIDFGFTNPFACLWMAFDYDGRAYIYDEHYLKQTIIREHAKIINNKKENYAVTYADPEAANEIAELKDYGIQCIPASKDKILGIQTVQEYLKVKADGKPRLFVFENCVNTIREFELYRWRIDKGKKNPSEEPLDKDNHTCDVARYILFSRSKSVDFSPLTLTHRDRSVPVAQHPSNKGSIATW